LGVLLVGGLVRSDRAKLDLLGHNLSEAKNPSQIIAFVRQILEHDNAYAREIVAEYSARSPLRAFDREHDLFLMHDDSDGKIYEVFLGGRGLSMEIPDDAGLSNPRKRA